MVLVLLWIWLYALKHTCHIYGIACSFTSFRFGICEPYQQVSELCNAYFDETDYVYIPNTLRRTQSQTMIANILSRIEISNTSGAAECRDNTLRIICHHFYIPCGRNGTLYPPTSICQEECSHVRDTCLAIWSRAILRIAQQLPGPVVNIDCEAPGSALAPLPSCCTGAGVIILPTSELKLTRRVS